MTKLLVCYLDVDANDVEYICSYKWPETAFEKALYKEEIDQKAYSMDINSDEAVKVVMDQMHRVAKFGANLISLKNIV